MTPDEFERTLRDATNLADDFIRQRAGKAYKEMSPQEQQLLNDFVSLGSLRVEISNDGVRCLMAAFRLCDRLMHLVMEHDMLRSQVTGEMFFTGVTYIDTVDDGRRACQAMQRAGKVMLDRAMTLLKTGELEAEVARLRATQQVLPKLGDAPTDETDEEPHHD